MTCRKHFPCLADALLPLGVRMPYAGYCMAFALCCAMPLVLDAYYLNLAIQIGYFAIAALGLNLLVGCSGQISIGHAAFFGFGAFTSAWLARDAACRCSSRSRLRVSPPRPWD